MATLRELKGRIGSVASSEKITGAMKMISSAKMHKAEQSLKKLLPFRTLIESIIGNLLASDGEFSSPLTEARDAKHAAILTFGSDDGLCGAYNVNIYKQLVAQMQQMRQQGITSFTIIPIGVKMAKAVKKLTAMVDVAVETPRANSKSEGDTVKALLNNLEERFTTGEFDRVDLLYMNFQSISRQRPRFDQFLPLSADSFRPTSSKQACRPCIFEPSAQEIFVSVIPMFLLSVLQEVFVENRASEQAARVMAMQSANDNAKKLLEQLRLEYNKLRQQSITTELLDIVGGQIR